LKRGFSKSARISSLLWLVGVGACTSMLGIEDLHEGARPGTEMNGGDGEGGNDATNVKGGSKNGGTTNGGSSNGGSSNGGTGNTGPGGEGGTTITPIGGEAGAGGAAPTGTPVHGHIIDFYGHAVPNVPVQIGDVLGSTDESGNFSFDNVPDKYDVTAVYTHPDEDQADAWAYLGLTRRDPTLQIFIGTPRRRGYIDYNFTPAPTLTNGQTISVGFGGPDGTQLDEDVSATGYSGTSVEWFGPDPGKQDMHALLWLQDANSLPVSFAAYGSLSGSFNDGSNNPNNFAIPLPKSAISKVTMSGTAAGNGGSGTRGNQVYLGFKDNARIKLVDDSGPANFSYVVPSSIAGADITVAAYQGYAFEGFAVAHADGLATDAKPALKIPPLVTLLTPAAAAKGVNQATKFTFKAPAANPGPFVAAFYSQDPPVPDPNNPPPPQIGQTIYIVTADAQFTLPTFIGGGFVLYPNNDYLWSIMTFGKYPSVDELASPTGFLDEYAWDESDARGPRKGSGEFTDTDVRRFTTAAQ
jgi:hypothetical protein